MGDCNPAKRPRPHYWGSGQGDHEEEEEESDESCSDVAVDRSWSSWEDHDNSPSSRESGEEGERLDHWRSFRADLGMWWENHSPRDNSPTPTTPQGTPPPDVDEGERRVQWADGGRQRWSVEHQESVARRVWEWELERELGRLLERRAVEVEETRGRDQWSVALSPWCPRSEPGVEQAESQARRALEEEWRTIG